MSRSKKKGTSSLKRDVRKEKNRGFRRHVKLKLKAGEFNDLPETPRKTKPPKTFVESPPQEEKKTWVRVRTKEEMLDEAR